MFVRPLSFRAGALAAAAAIAAFSATAATSATANAALLSGVACPDPTTQPFMRWADPANYAYAPNGGFENGATGWSLAGGAKVVTGNETFYVRDRGTHSLSLPQGSTATSPRMCVGLLSGKMRFFVQHPAGPIDLRMKVQVIYGGGTGGLLGSVGSILGVSDVANTASGRAWQPSAEVPMLGGTLPLLTQWVQFRFKPAASSGTWRIDDVYLDPLMHG